MSPRKCRSCGRNAFRVDGFCSTCASATVAAVTDKGIAESAAHAEAVDTGWGERALEFFKRYASKHARFLTEEVRTFAYAGGLPQPPAEGAWGAVARNASSANYVAADGKRESANPTQHGKWMTVWRSLIHEGA